MPLKDMRIMGAHFNEPNNIYPSLLQVMKMTRKRNGSVPSNDSD